MSVSIQTVDGVARVSRGDLGTACEDCGQAVAVTVDGVAYESVVGDFTPHTC